MNTDQNFFSVVKLGSVAKIQPGFAFKSERFTDNPSDIPLVKGENVQQGFIDWQAARYWPASEKDKFEEFILKPGDVVVAMDRPWVEAGLKWAYIHDKDPVSFLVQRVCRLTASKELDQTYLRCLISSSYFAAYLKPIVTGVNIPHISGKQIGDFLIPLPSIEVQKKIAAIISTYDDLIANDQRRITLLEGMAEEIYREWFIRMRFPGYELVSSAEGLPNDWQSMSLDRLGTFMNGYPFDPSEWFTYGFPIIKIKELNSGVTADTPRNPGDKLPDKYRICEGDIIFSWSGSLIVKIWDEGDAYLNQHLFKVIPDSKVPRAFLYLSLKFSIPIFESLTTGATMQHIKRKELSFVKVKVPAPAMLDKFKEYVEPILDLSLKLKREMRCLNDCRDSLLPRLISGKLKVDHLDIQFPPSMREDAAA